MIPYVLVVVLRKVQTQGPRQNPPLKETCSDTQSATGGHAFGATKHKESKGRAHEDTKRGRDTDLELRTLPIIRRNDLDLFITDIMVSCSRARGKVGTSVRDEGEVSRIKSS